MKTDLFQSCGHCWVFQISWHIECSIFTASSFRIWNSSAGIPSPPLALFVVMLPKIHLTSHSKMSGSRWIITPLWLFGSLRSHLLRQLHLGHTAWHPAALLGNNLLMWLDSEDMANKWLSPGLCSLPLCWCPGIQHCTRHWTFLNWSPYLKSESDQWHWRAALMTNWGH